jgi:hypothetical protein
MSKAHAENDIVTHGIKKHGHYRHRPVYDSTENTVSTTKAFVYIIN